MSRGRRQYLGIPLYQPTVADEERYLWSNAHHATKGGLGISEIKVTSCSPPPPLASTQPPPPLIPIP